MLTAEIRHAPVGRQLGDELLQSLAEVVAESGVVFKHNVRVDVFEQALFENQQVRSVASPRSVAGSPLRRRCDAAAVDRGEPFGFGERPRIGQLSHPFSQSIIAAIEVDQEAAFNDRIRPPDRLGLARVPLRGTFVRTCGWRC